ncbi:DUF1134 domain-containing protein [Sphingomonas changnyeongensis]|uniref:DUF1134 domain-containing protein n=1 Tax=Sphingomonas changnyeongensis TaxID=2698679 RepID=A0A7Z2S5K0_9SPHN|nr:DUF1134 domain-containing protein [Sphingomonas changnyeongensis]QHL91215.1 DUF1134 domain-containing protein [Sphingomonas changnyeongensis]
MKITQQGRHGIRAAMMATLALGIAAAPVAGGAQVRTIDPNTAIDADLAPRSQPAPATPPAETIYYGDTNPPGQQAPGQSTPGQAAPVQSVPAQPGQTGGSTPGAPAAVPPSPTAKAYREDDLIGAAEGVFGKGAKGLADIIRKVLKDQGEPSAYITGREAGGALVVGLRYGSGTLFHAVEGQRPVYWTGPSVGFDAGGDAGRTFVLVYNLHDSQELYQRFPAGQGTAYFIGGFTASYLRSGDIVLIPIRLGVGMRLGANVGYMKFTEKQNWFPF